MTNGIDLSKIIRKYVVILIIINLIEYLFGWTFRLYWQGFFQGNSQFIWRSLIPSALSFSMNMIMAIIVFMDMKRFSLKPKILTLLTLLWQPLGICLFFICLILNLNNAENKPAPGKRNDYATRENDYLDNGPDLLNI